MQADPPAGREALEHAAHHFAGARQLLGQLLMRRMEHGRVLDQEGGQTAVQPSAMRPASRSASEANTNSRNGLHAATAWRTTEPASMTPCA